MKPSPSAQLRSLIYRFGYPFAKMVWFVSRPHVNAAACIITYEDQILLIRQTYGKRHLWHIPGGYMEEGEDPKSAAIRELREETGIEVVDASLLATVNIYENYKHCSMAVYMAQANDTHTQPELGEIAEAKWFSIAEIPSALGTGTKQSLQLFQAHLQN